MINTLTLAGNDYSYRYSLISSLVNNFKYDETEIINYSTIELRNYKKLNL